MSALHRLLGIGLLVLAMAVVSLAGATTAAAQPPPPPPTHVPPAPETPSAPSDQPGVIGQPFPGVRPPSGGVRGLPGSGPGTVAGAQLAGILAQLDQNVLDRTADAVLRFGRIRMSMNDVLRAVRLAGCVECEQALPYILAATNLVGDHQSNRTDPLYLTSVRDRLLVLRLASGEQVTRTGVASWIRSLLVRYPTGRLGGIGIAPNIPFPSTQPPAFYDLVRLLPDVEPFMLDRIARLLAEAGETHPDFLLDGGLTLDEVRTIVADSNCPECVRALDTILHALSILAGAQASTDSPLFLHDAILRQAVLDLMAGQPVPQQEVVRLFDDLRIVLEGLLLPGGSDPSPAARPA